MDPITALTVANGLLLLVEKLVPEIQRLVSRGEITVAQQAELLQRIEALRKGELFSGPEWQVRP